MDKDAISTLRQQIWHSYKAMAATLRRLQRSDSMTHGSFYLLRRKCGKPTCHCAQGELHGSWVLTRSEKGKDRLYSVPAADRGQVRQWADEYRRYQRSRAVLVKRHIKLLALIDTLAQTRLIDWPGKKKTP